jgi:deoxyribodipyrimidine photo-lyase
MTERPVVIWFRRDLRLADNPALRAAAADGRPVIPLFVLDETPGIRPPGAASRWWLDKSLRALSEALAAKHSRLVLRRGPAARVVFELARELKAARVVWNRLHEPAVIDRDADLETALRKAGIEAESFDGSLLVPPLSLKTKTGGTYKVFTPFWNAAREAIGEPEPQAAPKTLQPPAHWPGSDDVDAWKLHPDKPDLSKGFSGWRPGETGAAAALKRFERHLKDYAQGRDRPAMDASSRLSPHINWGEVSERQVWAATKGASKFHSELVWRDFNHHLLCDQQDIARVNVDRRFDRMRWREDEAGFRAWTRGETGLPWIDAGMRQLWREGFMHNRVRMAAASFLVKHLLIDWRRGEEWFWDTLVDADPANNPANWQWVAGSGRDASPFFRVFNPVAQGERFDPDGAYVKRWVPELAKLPPKWVHAPWTAPPAELEKAGVSLGRTYPRPIVDLAEGRERALAAFRGL